MNEKNKFTENDLIFREIKEKERMKFYEYAFESNMDFSGKLGISFDFLKKFCRINRIFLGIPAKIFMKNTEDVFVLHEGEIVAGYTLINEVKKNQYMLGNLFTRPKFQRKGIATIVMNKIVRDVNGKKIELDVDAKNIAAVNLYNKFGFQETKSTKQFINESPLEVKNNSDDFVIRVATAEDLEKLSKLQEAFSKMGNIQKSYKNSFGKTKKKALRIENQFPAVILKDSEILGIGRARWSKGMPNTIQVMATAILPEAKEVYPNFVSFFTKEAQQYGIEKFIWDTSEYTKPFDEYIIPYLGEPARLGLTMVRNEDVEN